MCDVTCIRQPVDIELPSWLSLLWLLDGQHWQSSGMRASSIDDLLVELYNVLDLIEEA